MNMNIQVGIKLREAWNYVTKGIQNKSKFHVIQKSMGPDPFL